MVSKCVIPFVMSTLYSRTPYILYIINVTGVNRVLSVITPKYYWPGMYQDMELYIKGCEKCQRSKPKLKKTPGVLHPVHVKAKVSTIMIHMLKLYILLIITGMASNRH